MTDYLLRKKGKKQTSPAPDNLRSDDEMECVIGLCEGEIVGLHQGLRSLQLSSTPFLNADGSQNFRDAQVILLTGQPAQPAVSPRLGGLSRTRTVGVSLRENVPVTRQTFGGTPVHYIDIRVAIQALYDTDNIENGSIPCSVKVEWKAAHASVWRERTITVTGKTSSNVFVRELRMAVNTAPGEADSGIPLDLRVTLLPKAGSGVTQSVSWESFQEVQAAGDWNFDNTAILHFWTPASGQLSGLPEISGIYKLMKVKVPSNYNPSTRQYSGMWDGSWKIEWTDNPAYCLNDLVSNARYGLNAYGPITLNKWDVYRAGKFCDRFVPRRYIGLDGKPHTMSPARHSQAPSPAFDYYRKIDVGYGYDNPNNAELDQFGIQFTDDGSTPALFYGASKTIGWDANFTQTGTHTVYLFGDNHATLSVDGSDAGSYNWAGSGSGAWAVSTFNVAAAGTKPVVLSIENMLHTDAGTNNPQQNPHFGAAKIVGPNGTVVWHSRMAPISAPRCPEGWTFNPATSMCEKAGEEIPTEPRFTFNGLIAEARLSMEQVRYMAGAFHGVLYDDLDGTIRLCVPDESPPVAIFNPDNVVDGIFEYSFTDITTRYNDWTTSFINPDLAWVEDRVRLVNDEHSARYGRLPTDYTAVGCLNRSEAIRRTEYRLDMALNQTMMVQFKINRQACYVRPNDRVQIADPHMTGKQAARVERVSDDHNTLYLADEVIIPTTDRRPFLHYQTPGGRSTTYWILNPVGERTRVIELARTLGSPGVVAVEGSGNSFADTYGIRYSTDGHTPDQFYGETRNFNYTVQIGTAGTYTLEAQADDHVRVYVDGVEVLTGDLNRVASRTVELTAGAHTIGVTYSNIDLMTLTPPVANTPEGNPSWVGVRLSLSGTTIWSTRSARNLVPLPGFVMPVEQHFPVNICGGRPEEEKLWRIIGIDEDEGDADHLLVHAIEDWSFDGFEPSSEAGVDGYTSGTLTPSTGTVPVLPPTTGTSVPSPPPLSGCPNFTIEWPPSGRQIKFTPTLSPSYRRYNGEYVVKSRSQGSGGSWIERATVANAVIDHPAGAYEFKVLPMNDHGVVADMDSTPACNLSVPECPPVEVQGTPQNPTVSAVYDGSTSRWNYVVDWDDGGVYVRNYQVVVLDKDDGRHYRTQDVDESAFIYTGAMQIADSANDTGYRFEIRCRNYCDQLGNPTTVNGSQPPAADPTYGPSDPLAMNCGEIQKGKFASYTERVEAITGSGSISLDQNRSNVWLVNLTGNATISVSGGCSGADCGRPITVVLKNVGGGVKTVTYAMNPLWRDGENAEVTTANGGHTMHLLFDLGNGTWLAGRGGRAFG